MYLSTPLADARRLHVLHWPQTISDMLANAFDGKRGAGSEADDRTFPPDERDFLPTTSPKHPQGPRAGSLRQVQTAEVHGLTTARVHTTTTR